LNDKMF